ncbi:major facilitator superfamily MFS_1 [Burkholderia ambifaria MEX-5]|uniref:Major facilitator superfamily MFS_1 n=2 Tax=Burkholderia ambifaria TaxID=152480 RepID=B1T474_9BURK|nr:MFS transporter [Burkholderia ambifaria]EDT41629.1 major facilitator superfamily MFS_1 [Burkholderia ambifaria MEX-5]
MMKRSVLIIIATAFMSVAFGYTMPLLALTLKSAGATQTQIGISACAPSLAIILTGFSSRRLIELLGYKKILAFSTLVLCSGLFILEQSNNLYVWFAVRACIGATNGMLWIALESLLNHSTPALIKGRVIGIYTAATTFSLAMGSMIPIDTAALERAFFTSALLFCIGVAICYLSGSLILPEEKGATLGLAVKSLGKMPVECAIATCGGALVAAQITLLPASTPVNMNGLTGKDLLSTTLLGSAVAQILMGITADKLGVYKSAFIITTAGILLSHLMWMSGHGVGSEVLYFLWGGICSVLYGLALIMFGLRARPDELMTGNAGLLLLYETGSLLGPVTGGVLHDILGISSLPIVSALAFYIILSFLIFNKQTKIIVLLRGIIEFKR